MLLGATAYTLILVGSCACACGRENRTGAFLLAARSSNPLTTTTTTTTTITTTMESGSRPTAAYENRAEDHHDARLPTIPTPPRLYSDQTTKNTARGPPDPYSYAPSQQGSKDSSSDTPSDRGSAGASSATTSVAALDLDDGTTNPSSTPESQRQTIKPLMTSPARCGVGRATSPTPLSTPSERPPIG